jgi:hypothetical protein
MNATIGHVGLPVATHEQLLRDFRSRVAKVLGVNDPEELLDHAVAQACLELEAIAQALGSSPGAYAVQGVADRLELARELADGNWDPDRPQDTILPKEATDGSAES